jgi:hypothetical protein
VFIWKEGTGELPNHRKNRDHFSQYLAGSKRSVRAGGDYARIMQRSPYVAAI